MERSTSRNLFLAAIVLDIIATVLFFIGGGMAMNSTTVNPDGTLSTPPSAGIGALLLVAFLVYGVGGILAFVAWLGALIKTARLGQWLWFVLVLLLSWTGIMMLVYIFAGPTKPANSGQMA
jgi:hypothetical protein